MKKLILGFIAILAFADQNSFAATTKYVSVGTGAVTGIYYPAGGAICRLFNLDWEKHSTRCSVESTNGSVANINSIRDNKLDFSITQSDWLYSAYNGTGAFSDQKPFKELSSVFALHTETFAVVVKNSSNIKTIDDLVGKVVNFGSEDSGTYATMKFLMSIKGWNEKSFSKITKLDPIDQPQALCKEDIDVMLYASGNPNGVLQEVSQACRVRIIPFDQETINTILSKSQFYIEAVIPGGTYAGNPNDIKTFGVNAIFVASQNTPESVVYNITKGVFENFNNFKTLHPVFLSLTKESMVAGIRNTTLTNGAFPPIHPGALKYFKESGLLN